MKAYKVRAFTEKEELVVRTFAGREEIVVVANNMAEAEKIFNEKYPNVEIVSIQLHYTSVLIGKK